MSTTRIDGCPPGTEQVGPDRAEPRVSLGALVKRWITTTEHLESRRRANGDEPSAPWSPPSEVLAASATRAVPPLDPALVAPESVAVHPDPDEVEPIGRDGDAEAPSVARPALPHRRRGRTAPHVVRRLAVLIDAGAIAPDLMDGLFDRLADHGSVNVSRAYGDWTSPGAQDWIARLRHHGVQPCHQFGVPSSSEPDRRSLVAMTIDAVDLACHGAVDAVALVGDLASAYPVVQRLNAAGVAVLAYGSPDTPDDVRGLCEEFTDIQRLGSGTTAVAGRHRA